MIEYCPSNKWLYLISIHDKFWFCPTFPSNAGGSAKAGSPGLGGWFCFVKKSLSSLRGAEAGATVSSGI